MDLVKVEKDRIVLSLHSQRSKVRIADSEGNHVSSPTKCLNLGSYFVEWMITNENVKQVFDSFLKEDRSWSAKISEELKEGAYFIDSSSYSKREKVRSTFERINSFRGFDIYEYEEKFYSFERRLPSKIRIRITFKKGDLSVDPVPHMYVLIPFDRSIIKIKNASGTVLEGMPLGSGCYCEWAPSKADLAAIIVSISKTSPGHRSDLIRELDLDFKA